MDSLSTFVAVRCDEIVTRLEKSESEVTEEKKDYHCGHFRSENALQRRKKMRIGLKAIDIM